MQGMYFEGLELIEKNQDRIRHDFIGETLKQIDQISELEDVLERRRRRETGNAGQLELVDTEQFEEWLAVAEVISKAEKPLYGHAARSACPARSGGQALDPQRRDPGGSLCAHLVLR